MNGGPPAAELDPYEAYVRRDSVAGAGVHVIVVGREDQEAAERVALGLIELLRESGREADAEILMADKWFGLPRVDPFHRATERPLVLVTTARQPWTREHLGPLLEAIERCDHVVGRRSASGLARLRRWLAWVGWKLLFAVPTVDVHSPCRIHRREALEAIPIQSRSGFVDVELMAKATFLGHLIDEAPVPPLDGWSLGPIGADCAAVLKNPKFVREAESGPAEPSEGQQEGDDGPGGQDQQGRDDLQNPSALEQDHPVGGDELGER